MICSCDTLVVVLDTKQATKLLQPFLHKNLSKIVQTKKRTDDWEEIGGDPQPDGLTAEEEEELIVRGGEEEEEEEEDNDDEKYNYGYEEEESERGDEEEDEVMKEIGSKGDDDDMDPLDEYGEL